MYGIVMSYSTKSLVLRALGMALNYAATFASQARHGCVVPHPCRFPCALVTFWRHAIAWCCGHSTSANSCIGICSAIYTSAVGWQPNQPFCCLLSTPAVVDTIRSIFLGVFLGFHKFQGFSCFCLLATVQWDASKHLCDAYKAASLLAPFYVGSLLTRAKSETIFS